jgi:hypothetical protein
MNGPALQAGPLLFNRFDSADFEFLILLVAQDAHPASLLCWGAKERSDPKLCSP